MFIEFSVHALSNGVSNILINNAIREFNTINNQVDNRILIKSSDNISGMVLGSYLYSSIFHFLHLEKKNLGINQHIRK